VADGWLYCGWVVGTSTVRDVDPTWPVVGSRSHHSVGAWPLMLEDTTSVLSVDPGTSVELQARESGGLGHAGSVAAGIVRC